MKQIKFLKNIILDGKPIWYNGCTYECMGEYTTPNRNLYKLISEDLMPRGIDKILEGQDYIVIDIPEKNIQEKKTTSEKTEKPIKNNINTKKIKKND